MIDPQHPLTSWYLWITCTFFLFVYSLPLLFAPFRWARVLLWQVNEEDRLALYLGRCLGGVSLVVLYAGFRAAPSPAQHPVVLEMFAGIGLTMTLVHAWGALRRQQPWTETVEVALYAVAGGIAAALRSAL